MTRFFADLHVHIGRTAGGLPVKIAASARLTLPAILREASRRKGIDLVGVVDAASPPVLEDVAALVRAGEMTPLAGGGLRYGGRLTLVLAAEVGVDVAGREAHFLAYLPDLEAMRTFSAQLGRYVTNMQLSSQKARLDAPGLLALAEAAGGFVIPAHVFTPHKGYYGHAARRLAETFTPGEIARIPAVELGLSADTAMAARLAELDAVTFVSNSDAHSLDRIAREYNEIEATQADFAGLKAALTGCGGRVVANYGLDPRLGKYHLTWCRRCDQRVPLNAERTCLRCGGTAIVVGVRDRLDEVADRPPAAARLHGRPPYVHQVPLQFIPGVGARTYERLLAAFGTEMDILHRVAGEALADVVGARVAAQILQGRAGKLRLRSGGGGTYGRVRAPGMGDDAGA